MLRRTPPLPETDRTPMSLLVIGAPQALATAVFAAASSGERLHVLAEDAPSPLPTHAVLPGGQVREIDLVDTVEGASIHACVIVSESRSLPSLVTTHRELLAGKPVLLAPGGLAGALRVSDQEDSLLVAESTGFPAAGSLEDGGFTLRGIKQGLPLAAAEPSLTAPLRDEFLPYLPTLVASDLATTSMTNTNHIIHPPITLLNAIRVDSATPFTLYRHGVSGSLEHLLVAVDEERRAVCRAVGADDRSARDWLHGFYRDSGMTGETLVECLTSYPDFAEVAGPSTLDYRYLADDVPHGVAQWAALGSRLGVPTPSIDHVLAILEIIAPSVDLHPDEAGLALFLAHIQQHRPLPVPHP